MFAIKFAEITLGDLFKFCLLLELMKFAIGIGMGVIAGLIKLMVE